MVNEFFSKKLVVGICLIAAFAILAFSFSVVFTPFTYTLPSFYICCLLSVTFYFFNYLWDTRVISKHQDISLGIVTIHALSSLLVYTLVTSSFYYLVYHKVVFKNEFFYLTGMPLCVVFSLLTHSSFYLFKFRRLIRSYAKKEAIRISETYIVKSGNKSHQIPIKDIKYIHSSEKICRLFTWEDRSFIIDHSINQMQDICGNTLFFRANRQYLLSRKCVLNYKTIENNKICVSFNNGESINISRYKAPEFRLWIREVPSSINSPTIQEQSTHC